MPRAGAVVITKSADLSSPTGTIVAFTRDAIAPTGWTICEGQAISRTTFAALFAVIGETHGSGDGVTTFNIPDYRGRFLRGVSGVSGRVPDSLGRTAMNPGGNPGNLIGSVQSDVFASHQHSYVDGENTGGPNNTDSGGAISRHNTNSKSTGFAGGNETRPKNAYVTYLIKL